MTAAYMAVPTSTNGSRHAAQQGLLPVRRTRTAAVPPPDRGRAPRRQFASLASSRWYSWCHCWWLALLCRARLRPSCRPPSLTTRLRWTASKGMAYLAPAARARAPADARDWCNAEAGAATLVILTRRPAARGIGKRRCGLHRWCKGAGRRGRRHGRAQHERSSSSDASTVAASRRAAAAAAAAASLGGLARLALQLLLCRPDLQERLQVRQHLPPRALPAQSVRLPAIIWEARRSRVQRLRPGIQWVPQLYRRPSWRQVRLPEGALRRHPGRSLRLQHMRQQMRRPPSACATTSTGATLARSVNATVIKWSLPPPSLLSPV
eukprot:SAG31_NODE_216_length_20053_cov_9.223815_12_plen_322_part_00